MPLSIVKQYRFAAAHHLPEHNGKCRRPHGHNYLVEVEVSGPLQPSGSSTGMVLDFSDLDTIVQPLVDQIDHTDLNESIAFGTIGRWSPPTAEHIADYLAADIGLLLIDATLERVRVWETDKAYAEWRRA